MVHELADQSDVVVRQVGGGVCGLAALEAELGQLRLQYVDDHVGVSVLLASTYVPTLRCNCARRWQRRRRCGSGGCCRVRLGMLEVVTHAETVCSYTHTKNTNTIHHLFKFNSNRPEISLYTKMFLIFS